MRALRQMEKDGTGIWPYPSKKAFLARLRDYFEVGENAFTLLNRAAGLKQLNSIDEIFASWCWMTAPPSSGLPRSPAASMI